MNNTQSQGNLLSSFDMELERNLRQNHRMVSKEVYDPIAFLKGIQGGDELYDWPLQPHDGQETKYQVTARLMVEENARQEVVRWVTRKERARQNNANYVAALDKKDKQRRNRGNNLYNNISLSLKITKMIWTI